MASITPEPFAASPATMARGLTDDKFRIAAAWILTFVLCTALIATAYLDLHWGWPRPADELCSRPQFCRSVFERPEFNNLETHPPKGNPMNDAEPRSQEPRMPFLFVGTEIESLRQENARLKHLVVRLSAIISKNIAAQK